MLTLSIKALNEFISNKPYPLQVLLFYCLSLGITIFMLPVVPFISDNIGGLDIKIDRPGDIVKVVVLAPVIETFIFQYLVFRVLRMIRFFKNNPVLIVGISAVVFGLSHNYTFAYMYFAFLEGLVLAYILYFYEYNYSKAFWTAVLVHALRNGTALLCRYLLAAVI